MNYKKFEVGSTAQPPNRDKDDDGGDSATLLVSTVALVFVGVVVVTTVVVLMYLRSTRKSKERHGKPRKHSAERGGKKPRRRDSKQPIKRRAKKSTSAEIPTKTKSDTKIEPPPVARPAKMKHEKLDMRKFKARGPMGLKSFELQGTVRHDLDKEDSASLRDLQYDTQLNSLVFIGTEIEQLKPQSQLRSVSKEGIASKSRSAEGLSKESQEKPGRARSAEGSREPFNGGSVERVRSTTGSLEPATKQKPGKKRGK
ncbi:hypothetical protein Q1695_013125 [Nippostrongylus brasiliensis]|nr:hypothetical protein Q1695_013125 [Nippostrongylus brasiliensis]